MSADGPRPMGLNGKPAYSFLIWQLVLLAVASSAAVFAKVALTPLQEGVRLSLALSDNQLAFLQGPALAWPMLLIAAPLGLAVDKWSRAKLLRLIMLLLLAGSLLTVAAPNFALLFLARGLVGLGAFAMVPVFLSLLADLFPPELRGRAGMVMLIAHFGAVSLAFGLGGWLLDHFGTRSDAWRSAMLWLCGPVLAGATLLLLAFREPSRQPSTVEVREAGSLSAMWSGRWLIGPLIGGQIAAVIALSALMVWSAPSLARSFDMDARSVGAMMAIAAPGGGLMGTLVGGFLADAGQRKGGPRWTLLLAALLVAAGAPLGFFSASPDALMAGILLGLGVALLTAASLLVSTVILIVVPGDILGLVISISAGIGALFATALAPVAVSALSGLMGGPETIGIALGSVTTSAALMSVTSLLLAVAAISTRRAA